MMVPHEINLLLDSNPSNGATNTTSSGDRFEVQLQDALEIPKDAVNVTISAEESNIWWTVANIETGINDTLYITGKAVVGEDPTYLFTVVIPQGLYDLSQLNQAILRELERLGAITSPEPIISFAADEATSKIAVRFEYDGTELEFKSNSPYEIMGFNIGTYGPEPGAPVSVLAPNTAQFNKINYFLIHSDLTSRGIRFNNDYNQSVSKVQIDVPPGSLINSQPFNPPRINAQELVGSRRTNIRMWLTDDKNRKVNTQNEFWSIRLVIRYLQPYHSQN